MEEENKKQNEEKALFGKETLERKQNEEKKIAGETKIDNKKEKAEESSFLEPSLTQENQRFSEPQKAKLFAEKKLREENEKTSEKEETKTEEKKEERKKTGEKKPKKDEAVVNARDLPISTKHSIAICDFIRGKGIEEANFMLKEVVKMKKALPMKGEIPHRKGKIMSGRYPINATKQFIKLLKQLAANANVNGLEIEKAKIECKANRASRPYKRFGSERFKRTHVTLKLKEKAEKKQGGNKEKK